MDERTNDPAGAAGARPSAEDSAEQHAAWQRVLDEDPRAADLSSVTGYRKEETPWRFKTLAHHLVQVSHHLLVLGAEVSDFAERLADVLPEDTVLVVPDAAAAADLAERLAPRTVEIVEHRSDAPGATLPFAPERFDLVLARHTAFDAQDVRRVLAPGGLFVTEQVGGEDSREILAAFGMDHPASHVTLQNVERELTTAGFAIERSDLFRGRADFADMPTLLRFLRRTPHLAPAGLSVDQHGDQLDELADRMRGGAMETLVSRFWVQARTPEIPKPPVTDFASLLKDRPQVPEV